MKDERKIKLFTKAVQIDENGEKNEMEFFAEGSFVDKNGAKYITYKESELSGMEGTTTTLKITMDSLNIIRFGTYNSKLEFKQGEQTVTTYQTPYGNLPIVIDTSLLDINLSQEEQSNIHLKYSLNSGGEQALSNEIIISFR